MNKRTKAVLSIFLLATICLTPFALYGADQNGKVHKVEPGETAYSIAKAYSIALKDLYALNPGAQNGVKTGSELILPQSANTSAGNSGPFVFHTIQLKETLYSVSRRYCVSVQDIMDVNSGLTADTFQEGKVIRIPTAKIEKPAQVLTYKLHKAQKGETIFSIAKDYNITTDALYDANPEAKTSGVKKNAMVRIPQYVDKKLTETDVRLQEEKTEKLLRDRTRVKAVRSVKIGILFPFLDQNDTQSSRFVEYLQGFLLAVEDFKQKGYSAEVYVFNIDPGSSTKRLENLLETGEFKDLNVLIGGASQEQIATLSAYAEKQKIKYVIPFTSRNDDVLSNEYVFQVNTPQNYLYPAVSQAFARRFKATNVVFVNADANNDKDDFVKTLQEELQMAKIANTTITLKDNSAFELAALLSASKPNIIIPTSGSVSALNKLLPIAQSIRKDSPNLQFSLFGYPEWQTYGSQIQDNLHKLDTYFYSSFFVGSNQANAASFMQRFKARYGKSLMNLYPKYGLLGYDAGNYFLQVVKQYGVNFENNIEKFQSATVQSALSFKRVNNWGGFINTGFYFVHYGLSSTEKKEYK